MQNFINMITKLYKVSVYNLWKVTLLLSLNRCVTLYHYTMMFIDENGLNVAPYDLTVSIEIYNMYSHVLENVTNTVQVRNTLHRMGQHCRRVHRHDCFKIPDNIGYSYELYWARLFNPTSPGITPNTPGVTARGCRRGDRPGDACIWTDPKHLGLWSDSCPCFLILDKH